MPFRLSAIRTRRCSPVSCWRRFPSGAHPRVSCLAHTTRSYSRSAPTSFPAQLLGTPLSLGIRTAITRTPITAYRRRRSAAPRALASLAVVWLRHSRPSTGAARNARRPADSSPQARGPPTPSEATRCAASRLHLVLAARVCTARPGGWYHFGEDTQSLKFAVRDAGPHAPMPLPADPYDRTRTAAGHAGSPP